MKNVVARQVSIVILRSICILCFTLMSLMAVRQQWQIPIESNVAPKMSCVQFATRQCPVALRASAVGLCSTTCTSLLRSSGRFQRASFDVRIRWICSSSVYTSSSQAVKTPATSISSSRPLTEDASSMAKPVSTTATTTAVAVKKLLPPLSRPLGISERPIAQTSAWRDVMMDQSKRMDQRRVL